MPLAEMEAQERADLHRWSASDSPGQSRFQTHPRSFKAVTVSTWPWCSHRDTWRKHIQRAIFSTAQRVLPLQVPGKGREGQEPLVLQALPTCMAQQGCLPVELTPAALLPTRALPGNAPKALPLVCPYTHLCVSVINTDINVFIYTCTCITEHITHIYHNIDFIYPSIHTHMYKCMCMYACVYTHIYILTYT